METGAKLGQIREEAQSMRRELRRQLRGKEAKPRWVVEVSSSRATRDCVDEGGMDRYEGRVPGKQEPGQSEVRRPANMPTGDGQRILRKHQLRASVDATIGDMVGLAQVRFDIGHRKGSAGGREWQAWMLSKSVGDTVEAKCIVQQFWPPDIPTFWDCRRTGD